MHQELVFGGAGQVFEIETETLPREPVSVVVTRHTGEVQAAVDRCLIDPVTTVLAEDAPRGARVLHVGSTRGVTPNARYDVGGQRITVYRLDGEHRLILRRPLLEPAHEDTALRGCRILAPAADAWVNDPTKLTDHQEVSAGYQLVWMYAGRIARSTADLVRTPLQGRVIPEDVEGRFPGWRAAVNDPVRAIAEAADIVRRDVLRHPTIQRVRDAVALRELVILQARIVAVEEAVMFRGESIATLAATEAPYLARLAELASAGPPPAVAPRSLPALERSAPQPASEPRAPMLGRYQEIVHGDPTQKFEVEVVGIPREPVSVVVTSWTGEIQHAAVGCAIDPAATVLTQDAPLGARVLHVASTQRFVPNVRYDLGGAQRIVVADVRDEYQLLLRRPLVERAESGTPLRGCRILAPVDLVWVADASKLTETLDVEAGYQLVWKHANGTERTTADVVHTRLHARITPDEIEKRFPGWRAAVDNPALVIAEAAEIVRIDVLRHPHIRRSQHAAALRELVILRARIVAIEDAVLFGRLPYAELAAAEASYRTRLANMPAPQPPPAPPSPWTQHARPVSTAHLTHLDVIDAIRRWFGSHVKITAHEMFVFEQELAPRLQTQHEREETVKILELQDHFSRKAHRRREQFIARIADVPARAPEPVRPVVTSVVSVTAHLADLDPVEAIRVWLSSHATITGFEMLVLEQELVPRLRTLQERQATIEILEAHTDLSEVAGNRCERVIARLRNVDG
jgi:hypothetical protein